MKMLDEYEIKARYVPAVITALPIIIFTSFVKKETWLDLFANSKWVLPVENISLSVISFFFLMWMQRAIGKHVFERYVFKSGVDFPTTTMLLFQDKFLSGDAKKKIRKKIKADFDITLLNEQQERADSDEAKKTIRDAVARVCPLVGKGIHTFQYNCFYGMIRNLIAGSIWALLVSIINAVIFGKENLIGMGVCIVMALFFLAVLCLHKPILRHHAKEYAKCLFAEYQSINKGDKK